MHQPKLAIFLLAPPVSDFSKFKPMRLHQYSKNASSQSRRIIFLTELGITFRCKNYGGHDKRGVYLLIFKGLEGYFILKVRVKSKLELGIVTD